MVGMIIIIGGQILLLCLVFIWVLPATIKRIKFKAEGKRKAIERIALLHKEELAAGNSSPVLYRLDTPASLLYASGILFVGKNEVIFFPDPDLNIDDLRFNRDESHAEWVGTMFLYTGAAQWFKIVTQGKEHHFCVTPGVWTYGSKARTREVYEEIIKMMNGSEERAQ